MNGPINKPSNISLWPGWLDAASVFCGLIVVLGLAIESGPDILARLQKHVPLPRSLAGEALVTIGVFGEVAIGIFIARSAKRQEIESATHIAELNLLAEQERHARVQIEEKLLSTIGPRKLTPKQREKIAFMARELLPDIPFVIFVLGTPNIEETKESTDFAWAISDAFTEAGRDATVYTIRGDTFGYDLNDIWINLPSPALHEVGRVIFAFLREAGIKVVSCTIAGLPPVLFCTERNGSGKTVPTHDEIKGSIGIVVAQRSQPVFRLED